LKSYVTVFAVHHPASRSIESVQRTALASLAISRQTIGSDRVREGEERDFGRVLGGKKNSRRMIYAISPSLKLLPRLTAPHWGPLELEAREDQLILQLEESHRPSLGSACAETRGRLIPLCDASWDECYCLRGAGCFRMGQASKPNRRRLSAHQILQTRCRRTWK
jgi:hypothetical protein